MEKAIMPALTGRHYIVIAAVVIVILSWLGVLDTVSDGYVNSSLVQATAAFASARALNAVISMLQGTEVSLLVVSLSVGELLDPLDDLVEQYSTLMKYAIASLLMQKLLLLITSSTIFKVFLTLTGILAAGAAMLGKEKLFFVLFRLFVFVAFIRFALVIVVGINGAVGSFFINDQIDADVAHLQATAEVVEKTSSDNAMNTEVSAQLEERLLQLEGDNDNFVNHKIQFEKDLVVARTELRDAKARLDNDRKNMGLLEQVNLIFSVDGNSSAVDEAQKRVSYLEGRIRELDDKLEDNKDMISKINDQLQGKTDGWFEGVVDSVGSAATTVKEKFTGRIDRAVQSLTESASNMLNLMAAFLLKTMILPLVFLYMMIVLTRMIWNVDLSRYVKL